MRTLVFSVPDLSCGHCVQSVRAALEKMEGVSGVEVSLDPKEASVATTIPSSVVADAIRAAGYSPTLTEERV